MSAHISQFLIPSSTFAAKGQLTKVNQTKAKMENLARELQKVTLSSIYTRGYS